MTNGPDAKLQKLDASRAFFISQARQELALVRGLGNKKVDTSKMGMLLKKFVR